MQGGVLDSQLLGSQKDIEFDVNDEYEWSMKNTQQKVRQSIPHLQRFENPFKHPRRSSFSVNHNQKSLIARSTDNYFPQ
jgi:hypothetical protein